MRPGTKARLRLFLWTLLASTLGGAAYGGLVGVARETPVFGALAGMIHGALISSVVGAVEIFLPRTRFGRRLGRAPFLVLLLIKGVIYGTVIAVVVAGQLGPRFLGRPPAPGSEAQLFVPLSVVFSFAFTIAFVFVLQMGLLVGRRTL